MLVEWFHFLLRLSRTLSFVFFIFRYKDHGSDLICILNYSKCWLMQTAEKIFLVLEYCVGGDLAAYIQRLGRVSEDIARHFMRQLGMVTLQQN